MIKKIKSHQEAFEVIGEQDKYKTTIFYDIDDTLIQAKGYYDPNSMFRLFLSDFNARVHNKGRFYSYCDKQYVKLVAWYNESVAEHKWKLTETEYLRYMFKELNTQAYHYYYLTARGTEIHQHTKPVLQKLKLYPKPGNRMHRKDFYSIPNVTGRSGVRGNIIYAGGYDKCQLLIDAKFGCFPTVVMVDDSLANLESFERYFSNSDIVNFIGLHYAPGI